MTAQIPAETLADWKALAYANLPDPLAAAVIRLADVLADEIVREDVGNYFEAYFATKAKEFMGRAEAAEAKVARVRALAEEFGGYGVEIAPFHARDRLTAALADEEDQ